MHCNVTTNRLPGRVNHHPKPLYLLDDEPREIRIVATSLRVVTPAGRAYRQLPLERIERIICNATVRWEGRALSACLEHGIPITWVNTKGQDIGTAVPQRTITASLHESISVFVQTTEWEKYYLNWLRNRRMAILVAWAKSLANGYRLPQHVFNELKRRYVYQNQLQNTFVHDARGWCMSVVVRRLHDEGLDTQYWGFGGTALKLGEDLATFLWAELNLQSGAMMEHITAGPEALLFFETWVQKNEVRILHHLGDLKRFLRAETGTWH